MIRQVRDGDWMAVVIGVAFCTVVVTTLPWPLRVAVGAVLGLGLRSAIRWEAPPARRRAREKRYRAFSRWLLVSIALAALLGAALSAPNWSAVTLSLGGGICAGSLGIREFRHDHNKERGS